MEGYLTDLQVDKLAASCKKKCFSCRWFCVWDDEPKWSDALKRLSPEIQADLAAQGYRYLSDLAREDFAKMEDGTGSFTDRLLKFVEFDGECRRFPPLVICSVEENHENAEFPHVKFRDWCGEHAEKPNAS